MTCRCGRAAHRSLAATPMCDLCYDGELARIRGTLRQCARCGRTWIGAPTAECGIEPYQEQVVEYGDDGKPHRRTVWRGYGCKSAEFWRRRHARALALEPPDDDRPDALRVAGLRLADAVADGVITPDEAARWLAQWMRRQEAA